jgi:hypothetical protein
MGSNIRRGFTVIIWSVFILFLSTPVWAANIYVSPTGTGPGTKLSPTHLQNALDIARTNGADDTIYLQQGTYDASTAGTDTFTYGSADNDGKAVILKGGWNASFTKQASDRELTLLDGGGTSRVLDIVADVSGLTITFTVENLTIQDGFTNAGTGSGAGIRANNTNDATIYLTLKDCLFRNCVASGAYAGAMYTSCYFEAYDCTFSSNSAYSGGALMIDWPPSQDNSLAPILERCSFDDNRNTGGWQGNTIFNRVSPVVTNCTFHGRSDGVSSSGPGATFYNTSGAFPKLSRCVFFRNITDYWGAALDHWNASSVVSNCAFINNKAGFSGDGAGGAISMYNPAPDPANPRTVTVTNCTFIGNRSLGYQAVGAALYVRVQTLTVTNCIFYDNGTYGLYNDYGDPGSATISYSYASGGLSGSNFTDGGNNIEVGTYPDPYFVDVGNGDYRLQATSPCVDSGCNEAAAGFATDLNGNYRFIDAGAGPVVDMGAYEYSPEFVELTLFQPNGGETVASGSEHLIGWGAPFQAESFNLLYSIDNGLTWKSIVKGITDKGYLWQVPDMPGNKKKCLFKVVGFNLSGVKVGADTSAAPFKIEVVRLIWPNGDPADLPLESGTEHKVEWETNGTLREVASAQLFYTVDGGLTWKQMQGSPVPDNPESFDWTVPAVARDKPKCKAKVVLKDDKGNSVGNDVSDAFFKILKIEP